MTTKTKVAEFEVVDHGIDYAQHFQGCGVAFSRFEHCVTGCGDNAAEAIEDALESIARSGHDVENMAELILVDIDPAGDSVPEDWEECYYYVSIRYNVEGESHA